MIIWLALAQFAHAQDVLPVRRVRFYETGVAYFERSGTVSGDTQLPVPRSHLDDALKTLVVLGGQTEVGAIRFPSSTSDKAARVLAGFGEGGEQLPFEATLRAMQGFEVEIETAAGRTLSGLLMDVSGPIARPQSTEGDPTALLAPEYTLTQLLADGSLVRTTTTEVVGIRPRTEQLTRRLEQAVLSTGTGRARQERALTVDLWESGPLALGYLAETPVWRVSYRAILSGEGADLQAWALVHNDTDEDWSSVRVELANGRPDSFLYPLATPRYAERALVTPEVDLAPVPQLATDTPDGMWDAGMSISGSGYGYGAAGFGARGSGSVGVSRGEPIALGSMDHAAQLKEAEPVQTATQFIYKVARPLDLPAQHSALVPLVQAEIAAEAVVAFTLDNEARNGMWITNDTARTLPAGVLSVFEAGGLAGESALDRLKPEEHQMVLFGSELDLELARDTEQGEGRLTDIRYEYGLLQVVDEQPRTERYTLTNRSGRAREVWVAMPLTVEEELHADRQELDPQRNWTWLPLSASAGESTHTAEIVRVRQAEQAPSSVAADTWRRWAEQLPDRAEPLLVAAKIADELSVLQAERQALTNTVGDRRAELGRLREDLRAAGDASGGGALTRRVAATEQEIRKLEAQITRADERIREQQRGFDSALTPLAPVEVSSR